MDTPVEWTDYGGSCLTFMREKGKEKERQRQKEGSQDENVVSILLNWMVRPLTQAKNIEKKQSWRKMNLVLKIWSLRDLRVSSRQMSRRRGLWSTGTWEDGQGQMDRLDVISLKSPLICGSGYSWSNSVQKQSFCCHQKVNSHLVLRHCA